MRLMQTASSRAWHHTLWRLSGCLSLTGTLGLWFGNLLAGLCLGLTVALAWHYLQLHRLLRLLGSRQLIPPADGRGVFHAVHQQLYQRQRESRLRKRRLQGLLRAFREAAAALPDAVVVVYRRDGRIAWFNESAMRLLGLRHPADVGMRITHLLRSPQVVEWYAAGAAEPLLDVVSPIDAQTRLSLRVVEHTSDQQLLIARDISKLMQLEQVRRDFVANVSHELRTPLTVVHGYLDMLDDNDHPEWAPVLDQMRQQSLRMTHIVEDLLTLSRLESLDRVAVEPVAMTAMLTSLGRDAAALSGGRHRVELDDAAELDLIGSAKELHSAFSNLVSNAVRYTPAGGLIRIRWAADPDGKARLEVIDSGPGIASQHLPRITERFYRVSNSRSRETGGTGLGLAIVKHALHLHHARLDIRSELGRGSTFACVFDRDQLLPRKREPA